LATYPGSFAQGWATGYEVSATGTGSFAHGHASAADIKANATHAIQFGEGQNDQQHSLQIEEVASGSGIRIGSRIPATEFTGDLYHDNSNSRLAFGGDVNASGSVRAELGLSGSLTQLSDGTSYLIEGANITITSASNGAVTIASTAGGTPGGSDTQVQFNQSGAFAGSANLLFDPTGSVGGDGQLTLTGSQAQNPSTGELGVWEQYVTGTTISSANVSGTFGNLTLSDNSVYLLQAFVVGRESNGNPFDRATFEITAQAYRSGSTAVIGDAGVQTDFMDRTTGSYGATFVPATNDIAIAVSGSTTATTNWFATVKYAKVT
jgi:hypothetical protein